MNYLFTMTLVAFPKK